MSDTRRVDISDIAFNATVFPTAEDRALWESLSPEQRLAVLERDEEAGFRSGVAENASLREIRAELQPEAEQ